MSLKRKSIKDISEFEQTRFLKKWSQTELGRRLGVSHNTVSKIERGLIRPRQDLVKKLSKIKKREGIILEVR